jgi:hypothetical protein
MSEKNKIDWKITDTTSSSAALPVQSMTWPTSFPATGVGTNVYPTFWTNTVEVYPQKCVCGGNVKKETVCVRDRKVKTRDDRRKRFTVVTETRDALVCAACGVIGWFGSAPSP